MRRVTFNVGRVAEVTATSVMLAQPLLAGAPAAGASAQVVVAFVDREGGSFFQEWSALFVAEPGIGRAGVLLLSAVEPESWGRTGRSEFEVWRGMEAAEKRRRNEDECDDKPARQQRKEFVAEVSSGRFRGDCRATDVAGVACSVRCAAVHGHQRWANSDVLSKLFSRGDGSGVLRTGTPSPSDGEEGQWRGLSKFANCDVPGFHTWLA